MSIDHVRKRKTGLGRWFPFIVYGLYTLSWLLTGILFGQWQLLWLVVLPLASLVLYWIRTQRTL